jgi:hypothetical protein
MSGFISLFSAAQALTGDADNDTFEFWMALLVRQVENGTLHGAGPGPWEDQPLADAPWYRKFVALMDWKIPEAAFDAWCIEHGYIVATPTPAPAPAAVPVPVPPKKEGLRHRQVAAILSAINDSGYDPLCIPRGGKKKIEDVCLDNAQLFTSGNSFERAWQAAGKQGRVRVKDHKVYARGM